MLRKYLHQWAESSNKEGLSGIRSEKSGAEAVKSKATASKDDKVLHLVRHGVTEMNVFLGSAPQGMVTYSTSSVLFTTTLSSWI